MADEQTKTIRIVIDASKARDGAVAVEKALNSIDEKLAKLGDSITGSFSTVFKGIAAFFTFDAMINQVKGLTEAFDRLGSRSAILGVSTQWMQAFEFAAASSSVKLDAAGGALDKFARTLGNAGLGDKSAVDFFDRLQIKVLDLNKQLRPVNDVFEETARKLAAMDAGGKQVSLTTQSMGRDAARVIPMFAAVGQGADAMMQAGTKAGAIVSRETVKIWEDLATAADRSMLKWRAFAGENFAESVKKGFELITSTIGVALKGLRDFGDVLGDIWVRAKEFAREQTIKDIRGDILPGIEKSITAQESKVAEASRTLRKAQMIAEQTPTGASLRVLAESQVEYDKQARFLAHHRGQKEFQAARLTSVMIGDPDAPPAFTSNVDPAAKPGGSSGAFSATAADPGAGDRQNKRIQALQAEAAAQRDMAKAALSGAAAVMEEESKLKALKDALEVAGANAKASDPHVQALAKSFKLLNDSIAQDKLRTAFRLGTEDLERGNELQAKRLELMNAAPEVAARELAVLQVQNEVKKTGIQLTQSDIDARVAAVSKQEMLNQKMQEAARAQELWTAPLKRALESIQTTAADAWQGILESGTISFQSLGDVFKKVILRMAAEFLALATIRPVMSVLVQGASSMGFLSGGQAASMGYGGGVSVPGGGGGVSGLSSIQLPDFLGGGSPFGFLNAPISPGSMPAGMFGPAQPGLGGLTWGAGLGAAAGFGMGAYQLATSKTTAGTIGGIGSMIGAGISLIPGMAPIGMGISLLSSILPGLFGGAAAPLPPLSGANTRFDPGAGGYVQSGSQQNGGASINGQFSGIGSTLDAFFQAAGGLTDPGKAFGAAVWNNQREGTTSTYLLSPTQGSNQQTYNESGDPAKAIDRLIAKAFYNSVQNNAAMNASPTLRTAFANREPTGTAQISGLFELIKAYDQLGKETTKAEAALKAIDASFAGLTAGANEWGLSLAPITAELTKQRKAYAEDFLHTIDSVLDPVGTALDDFAKERADGMKEWKYINDNVKEVVIAQAKVEEFYAKKEAALKEQLYGGAVSQLEDAIRRLMPGGALANLDPGGQLAGLEATYRATYGQAAAGDAAAIARLAGQGVELADYSKTYFAGSPEYNALRDEILANLQAIQAAIQSPAGSSTPLNTNDPGIQTLVQQVQTLTQLAAAQSRERAEDRAEITRLTNLLSRYLTNGQRAA